MTSLDAKNLREAIEQAGSIRAAERYLRQAGHNISARTIARRLQGDEFEVDALPDEVDVEALIRQRVKRFERTKMVADASEIRTVRLKSNSPIGIGFQGDGHIDDEGTDIGLFFKHARLFNGDQKGLYLGFMGDIWNNWVGRLTKLFARSSVTDVEARALIEHYVGNSNFLFFLLGNHDLWNEKGDLLTQIIKTAGTCNIVAAHQQKIKLVFPNGRSVIINARHKYPGSSMWMTQFGQVKLAQLEGQADIYVGGDKHVSGYSNGIHPGTKRMFHALQVASYKVYDEYPIELGLLPRDLYVCPVAIITPDARDDLNLIRWEFDPFEGAERLKWERSRH